MAKQKVTLSLDAAQLAELRSLTDSRSLSATVDVAVKAHLKHLRHLRAVDEWLEEMEQEDGPIPAEITTWAKEVVDDWEAKVRANQQSAAD